MKNKKIEYEIHFVKDDNLAERQKKLNQIYVKNLKEYMDQYHFTETEKLQFIDAIVLSNKWSR